MKKVNITESQIKIAQEKADEMGRLKNSIQKGKGNLAGFLGELLVAKYIGAQIKNTYDYDLIKGALKFDVKTKLCTSEPKPEYECSVAAYNVTQDCHYYVFVRIHENYKEAWLLGGMRKEEFYNKARFCEKGKVDKKSKLGWRFKADCYNLEINQLKSIDFLRNLSTV